jgi:hypothetical protein
MVAEFLGIVRGTPRNYFLTGVDSVGRPFAFQSVQPPRSAAVFFIP